MKHTNSTQQASSATSASVSVNDAKSSGNQLTLTPLTPASPTSNLLQSIITNLPDAFIGIDKESNIIEWNRQAETMLGWTAKETIGQPLSTTIIPPRYREAYQKGLQHFLQTGESNILGKALEFNAIRRDGQEFPVELVISATKDENGYKCYAFIRDITLRKKQEMELIKTSTELRRRTEELQRLNSELEKRVTERTAESKQSSEQLKLALHVARAGTWTWDVTNDVVSWDEGMYELFGYSSMQTASLKSKLLIDNSVHPEDKQRFQDCIKKAIQTESGYEIEYRIIWPDNSIHYLLTRAQRERNKQSHVLTFIGMAWDITLQKNHEKERLAAIERAQREEHRRAEEAEAFQRRQTELINTICHEIRNPLQGIYGQIDSLSTSLKALSQPETKTSELARAQEALDVIEYCADQQKTLVDDILDLSRLEAKKVELHPTIFDPTQIIRRVVIAYTPLAEKKGLHIKLQLTEITGNIKCDAYRFSQVLTNLLTNAIKFTEQGNITITAKFLPIAGKVDESVLECNITDTGVGMTLKESQKLFTPFTQGHRRISSTHGGSGLGLTICKRLVELMGGNIQIKSQKGHGTQVKFTIRCILALQQTANTAAQADVKQIQLASLFPVKSSLSPILIMRKTTQLILIVEDNLVNQKILGRFLESGNYAYEVANNGVEALEKYEQFSFGLVFMDVVMPVMDGLEATRRIRAIEKKVGKTPIPIIGLSGNATKEQIAEAKLAGMTDYLAKPYLKVDCYRMIRQHMIDSPLAIAESRLELPQPAMLSAAATASLNDNTSPLARSNKERNIQNTSAAQVKLQNQKDQKISTPLSSSGALPNVSPPILSSSLITPPSSAIPVVANRALKNKFSTTYADISARQDALVRSAIINQSSHMDTSTNFGGALFLHQNVSEIQSAPLSAKVHTQNKINVTSVRRNSF